jgi:hypothetical protein
MRTGLNWRSLAVLNRLTLQAALGAAFGTGQLILAMVAAPMPFASRASQFQPPVAATITVLPAPVGIGWG